MKNAKYYQVIKNHQIINTLIDILIYMAPERNRLFIIPAARVLAFFNFFIIIFICISVHIHFFQDLRTGR